MRISSRRRVNFLPDLAPGAQEWTTEQDYHRRGLDDHAASAHLSGVIRYSGQSDALTVSLDATGARLHVSPGRALDGAGRILQLDAPALLDVPRAGDPSDRALPWVLVLRSSEDQEPRASDPANPSQAGCWIVESALLEFRLSGEPELGDVELVRGSSSGPTAMFREPVDPGAPGLDELDRRFVHRVSVRRPDLSPNDLYADGQTSGMSVNATGRGRVVRDHQKIDPETRVSAVGLSRVDPPGHQFFLVTVRPDLGEGREASSRVGGAFDVTWRMQCERTSNDDGDPVLKYGVEVINNSNQTAKIRVHARTWRGLPA